MYTFNIYPKVISNEEPFVIIFLIFLSFSERGAYRLVQV